LTTIPNLTRICGSVAPKLRRFVPADWTEVEGMLSRMWTHTNGLRVGLSCDVLDNRSRWLHLSVSRSNRLPSWEDMKFVKDAFIGRDHEAIQVLPKDEDFVNLHPFCLHLWSPEEC
jgi:hypothetical protein